MENHTPGPWEWNYSLHRIEGPNGEDVLVGRSYVANARLLACAPELLEVLAGLLSVSQPLHHETDNLGWSQVLKAKTAIAKATGEE